MAVKNPRETAIRIATTHPFLSLREAASQTGLDKKAILRALRQESYDFCALCGIYKKIGHPNHQLERPVPATYKKVSGFAAYITPELDQVVKDVGKGMITMAVGAKRLHTNSDNLKQHVEKLYFKEGTGFHAKWKKKPPNF